MTSRRHNLASLVLALLGACKSAPADTVGARPSPQAQAEPAPLANVAPLASAPGALRDAGAWPEPLRTDQRIPPDVARDPANRETRDAGARDVTARESTRDLAGYELQAVLRAGEGPGPPKSPEVNPSAIEAAKHRGEPRIDIEISATRARFVIGAGFVIPPTTELRARVDRYGHLLLWPGEHTYRVVEAGALRALFGERRLDVAPLSAATVRDAGDGPRKLNAKTRRVEVSTRAARATFELAVLREAGEGGTLVCRMLLDLMGAPPSTDVCADDEVPLHAELRWTTQGSLAFDVTSATRRTDLSGPELAAPPAALTFVSSPPPPSGGEMLLGRAELTAFRTAAIDVPPSAVGDAQPPPEGGLALVNSSDELRVAWIDGAPAAWVGPGARLALTFLLHGRYTLEWRTFLGDAAEPAIVQIVPGTSEVAGR
ncbi:MAG TPA: hypothetical protein VKU41_05415 [Polyangiaceae bacterium]|nr:hypothetical protein [Polyangiaceae bacterium]